MTAEYDKRCKRELLKPGRHGNILEVYGDLPEKWDTWNIEEYSSRKNYMIHETVECKVLENDGITAAVKVNKVFYKSCFEQRTKFYIFCLSPYWNLGGGGDCETCICLNLPVRCGFIGKQEYGPPPIFRFVECSSENAVVETIKPSEDDREIILPSASVLLLTERCSCITD